jgi:hypothetical protein
LAQAKEEEERMSKRLKLAGAVMFALVLAAVTAGSVARAGGTGPSTPEKEAKGCKLGGHDSNIKHVIYLQFDNTHLFRDRSNFASDLELMPHLKNFLEGNGTLSSNEHTILISHTAGGILSSLTGLYPDRHGQAVSNSYGYFRSAPPASVGTVGFSSSFKYWTDTTDGGNPANNPPTPSGDPNYNMVTPDPSTGAPKNTPAPWVPWARAGCDVGNISTANAVLENNNAIVFRSPATSLKTAAVAGATSVTVKSVAGLASGDKVVLDRGNAANELETIASVGPPDPGDGSGTVNLGSPLGKAHAANAAFTVYSTDPTGDMTKVFGEGSPEWIEGRDTQISPGGTAAGAKALTDFVGIAIHCAAGGGICKSSLNAKDDTLPDEPGGYTGFKALFGAKYVNPAITNPSSPVVNDTAGAPITDPFGQPGFPGFDGMPANVTLGYVAQMQEAGVPVTFGYISDAHDNHKNAFPAAPDPTGMFPRASGPGESDYVAALKSYDDAFATFFTRLEKDKITTKNTLFVVTADENDHFAGGVSNDGNWSHTYCNLDVVTTCPANQIGEVNANLTSLLPTDPTRPSFSVHSDSAPTVYVNGNPVRTDAALRKLERDMSVAQALDPYVSSQKTPIALYLADKVGEKTLHMVTADQQRTPSFTLFANPDYFLTTSDFNCSYPPAPFVRAHVCVDPHFAWSHGDATDDIGRTWLGFAGPGVRQLGQTSSVWTDHTDIQPTMLSLAGLSNDYVPDGRVITQFVQEQALPHELRSHRRALTELGVVYKEINAPFGPLSYDVLSASTRALSSGSSSDDSTYTAISDRIASLTSDRDTLAAQMRTVLNNAAFGGPVASSSQISSLIDQGNTLLMRANQLGVANSP